ncbi:hypothetical protein DPMN_150337 [Dreissena polymorpha]|uniref:Uncharacterized protein n=1 Tax=Dreissena polymorpha TaxID=45954 RepID=A0A9D4FHJ8_DREPO|nr:hypothetical protein DPMN_150337 [Dreissena polymorpha]
MVLLGKPEYPKETPNVWYVGNKPSSHASQSLIVSGSPSQDARELSTCITRQPKICHYSKRIHLLPPIPQDLFSSAYRGQAFFDQDFHMSFISIISIICLVPRSPITILLQLPYCTVVFRVL